jgi:hypothetical protein
MIEQDPFMLSLSKHAARCFHNLLGLTFAIHHVIQIWQMRLYGKLILAIIFSESSESIHGHDYRWQGRR